MEAVPFFYDLDVFGGIRSTQPTDRTDAKIFTYPGGTTQAVTVVGTRRVPSQL